MSTVSLPHVWTLDGMVFGDGTGGEVTDWSGWDETTATRRAQHDRVGDDGVYLGPTYYGPRSLHLEGVWVCANGASADDARDRLLALFTGGGRWGRYQVSRRLRGRDRSFFGVVDGVVSAEAVGFGQVLRWSVDLISDDHRLYSTATVVSGPVPRETGAAGGVLWNGSPGTSGGATDGVRWNGEPGSAAGTGDGVRWQSGVSSSGVLQVVNSGRAPAPVTIQVTAGSSGLVRPSVALLGTDRRVTYNGELLPGDVWTVDTATGSGSVNGSPRAGSLLVARFFDLAPGANLLHFTSEGLSDDGTLHTVHRHAYLNG